VTPKLVIGIKARERLRQLAAVFSVELRLRIVSALNKRPMSAKQFFEEHGGGTLPRVTQNFQRLADTGWLRLVDTKGPGGARHGAVEHFYRSTKLAFFDDETWALVPYSMRVACSWSLFKLIAKRLRKTLEVTSEKPSLKRDLSCVELSLDQAGWDHVIEAVSAQFVRIFEEQEDSQLRAVDSGEQLVSVNVLLIAFESPTGRGQIDSSLVEIDKEPLIPFPERLAPVLADDVCLQIVFELNHRPMSVTQFHREFGGATRSGIRSRFKRLERTRWLKKVDERTGGRRRGATEHFYRATRPAMTSDAAWQEAPDSLRGTQSWRIFKYFCEKVLEAMRAGTFDARTERSVTLSFLDLDQRGWTNVIAGIESLAAFLLKEQECAKERMRKSGEKPIAATVGLAAFETPAELAREP
jgi:DNA-binding HxlR family transcriptional regulator